MKLNKGLWTDGEPSSNPIGTWRDARNILIGEKADIVSNEQGIVEFGDPLTTGYPSGTIKPIGTISIRYESVIVFSIDIAQAETISEIGIITKYGIYTKILSDPLLKFKAGYPISGQYKYNFQEELIAAFTDYNDAPKLLNLTDLPFEVDGNKAIIDPTKSTLMYMFTDVSFPLVVSGVSNDSGGSLVTGVYYAAFAYELPDTALTSWSTVTNPVSITDSIGTETFEEYDGAEPGTLTAKSITFSLQEVDTRYAYIHLAIIKKVDGVQTYFQVSKSRITSSNLTIEYTGNEVAEAISLNEILVARPVYIKIKTFATIDRQLYGGNVEKSEELEYQKYANNIRVNWVYEDIVTIQKNAVTGEGLDSSYKSNNFIFIKKSFMPDEVYALYIRLHLTDGTKSQAFHIPGRGPNDNIASGDYAGEDEEALVSTLTGTYSELTSDLAIDANVKLFHTRGTATQLSGPTGGMGFWENADETYPTTDNFDVWDVDGSGVGSFSSTIKGENVRHHKFPSLRQLNDFGYQFVDTSSPPIGDPLGSFDLLLAGGFEPLWIFSLPTGFLNLYFAVGNDSTAAGDIEDSELYGSQIPNIIYAATQDQTVTLTIDGLKISATNTGGTVDIYLYLQKLNSSNSVIETIADGSVSGLESDVAQLSGVFTINLLAGEKIKLKGFVSVLYDDPKIFFVGASGIHGEITTPVDDPVLGGRFSRVLGLKLDRIKFPVEIKDKIVGYEILYANREPKNATVLGMGMLLPKYWENSTVFTDDEFRIHPFDMIKNKIGEVPTYISNPIKMENPSGLYGLMIYADSSLKDNYIRSISNTKYLPANNIATVPDNEKREQCYYGEVGESLPNIGGYNYLTCLNSFRRNVYKEFTSQTLITVGTHYVTNIGTFDYSIDKEYGGDTYITQWGYKITSENGKGGSTFSPDRYSHPFVVVHAVSNIGLRHREGEWWETYSGATPSYPYETLFIDEIPAGTVDDDGNEVGVGGTATDAQKFSYLKNFDNFYGYNTDYSSNGNNNVAVPFDSNIETNEKQHYTIIRTVQSDENEIDDSWRVFLEEDQKTMARNRGVIWSLKAKRDQLIIQMEESSLVTIGATKLPTTEVDVTIGTGDIFQLRPRELLTTEDGYVGTHSQYGNILTKYGLFIPDETHGKIFMLSDKITELSEIGMRNYFRDNLALRLSAQLSRLLGYGYVVDNPYVEAGIIAVHDEKFDRIIVTKRDYEIKPENEQYFQGLFNLDGTYSGTGGGGTYQPNFIVIKDNILQHIPAADSSPDIDSWLPLAGEDTLIDDYSFTISYTADLGLDKRGSWICWHDYIPHAFFNTKNNVYSFNEKMYVHNDDDSRVKFYTGTVYDTYIDMSFNHSPAVAKMFFNTNWRTELYEAGVLDRDNTFDEIQLINSYQTTDVIALSVFQGVNSLDYNVRNVKNTWNFNKMRDNNSDYWNRRRLIDKYLRVIFTYKNLDSPQKVLYLYEVNMKMRLAERGIKT